MRTIAVLWVLLAATALQAEPLRAGAAVVDITPPTGYPMWGYGARHDLPSVGVKDALKARALVLAVGTSKMALVSLDLGRAPARESMARIRAEAAKVGIPCLFVVASHTHHGPVIELDHWPRGEKPYVRRLEEKIVEVVSAADKELGEARLGVDTFEVAFNRNRHSKRADAPRDRDLVLMRVEDARGKVLAHAVNFAAHPTMLSAKGREFSPDFPGFLASHVEQELGGVCLFLQGASGDMSANPALGATAEKFGAAVGAFVVEKSRTLKCGLAEPRSLRTRERAFKFASRVDLESPLIYAAYSMAFFPGLIDFYRREYREGVRPHLTTALLDGRIGLVGVSGEFFSGHAVQLRRRARLEHVLFLGYCNDYHQYFPTIEAVAEGGYGADATVAPVTIGAGERIMDQALIDLFEMQGKLRAAVAP